MKCTCCGLKKVVKIIGMGGLKVGSSLCPNCDYLVPQVPGEKLL